MSSTKKQGDKEALFLAEKNKIMAALAAATSKEEFKERLKAIKAPQHQNIKDEEVSSSSNYFRVMKTIATEYWTDWHKNSIIR